jgi:hypothetical protein
MNTARRIGQRSFVTPVTGAALALTLAAAGCCSRPKPEPFTAPPVTLAVDYRAGDPLGGGAKGVPDDANDASQAVATHLELYCLEHLLEIDALEPLEARVRLITSVEGRRPFPPVPEALAGSGYAVGEGANVLHERLLAGELGRFARVGSLYAAIPRNVTGVFRIRRKDVPPTPWVEDRVTNQLEVLVHVEPPSPPASASKSGSGHDGISLALAAQLRNAPDPDEDTPSDSTEGEPAAIRETYQLDLRPDVGETVVLLLRTPETETRTRMIAAFLRTGRPGTPPSPTFRAALRRCTESLAAGAVAPVGVRRERADQEQLRCDIDAALRSLSRKEKRRQALAFLARLTGAELALEAAFLLDDDIVTRIAGSILGNSVSRENGAKHRPVDSAAFGWLVERSTAEVLTPMLNRPDTPIAIEGLMVRYAGEVGRHPGAMSALLSVSDSIETFHTGLLRVNLIHLDDHSLAARIRAFDWLRQNGHAIEGYDPLGPREKRREAVRRARARIAGATEPSPEASP